jgi:AcrR family transcriptional regulator
MAMQQRLGVRDSEIRARLLDTAIGIVEAEGCNALTMGRLARSVGLTRPSVHYYFGTIEDVFVEILRTRHEEVRQRTLRGLDDNDAILREIWNFRRAADAVTLEFMAMALRSEKIRAELSKATDELLTIAAQGLEAYAARQGIALPVPAIAMATILRALSYNVAMGKVMGATAGQQETIAAVEAWLNDLERRETGTRAS